MMSSCPASGWDSGEELLSSSSISPRLSCPEPREWKNEEPEVYDEDDLPSVGSVSDAEEVADDDGDEEVGVAAPAGKWAWFASKKRPDVALKTIVGMNRGEYERMAEETKSDVPFKWMMGVILARNSSTATVAVTSVESAPPALPAHDATSESPETEEGTCSICWGSYEDSDTGLSSQLFLNCGHDFCQECVRTTVLMATKNRTEAVRLVCPDRACDVVLDDGLVGRLLTPKERATLERVRHLAELSRNPNLRYCPQPKCSAMVATAGPLQPCAKCPACRHEFCFFCLQEWHGVQKTCQEFAEELKARAEGKLNETLAMNEWLETAYVKKCPTCLTPIMKSGGCRHMTCTACAFQYCWFCLDGWAGKPHSACENLYIDAFGKKVAMPKRHVHAPGLFYPQNRSPAEIEALVKRLEQKKASRERKAAKGRPWPSLASRLRAPFTSGRGHKRRVPQDMGEFKFVLTGAGGSGKSGLVNRFCQNVFVEEWDYDLESSYRKQVDGVLLDILDTSGCEDFVCLADQWYRSAEAFIVTFSPETRDSLERARETILQILRVKDETEEEAAIVLVGTKCDLYPDGALPDYLAQARELAVKFQCPMLYTSALEDVNINETFMELLQQARRRRRVMALTRHT